MDIPKAIEAFVQTIIAIAVVIGVIWGAFLLFPLMRAMDSGVELTKKVVKKIREPKNARSEEKPWSPANDRSQELPDRRAKDPAAKPSGPKQPARTSKQSGPTPPPEPGA